MDGDVVPCLHKNQLDESFITGNKVYGSDKREEKRGRREGYLRMFLYPKQRT
jgi:hypothetical protein